MKMKKFQCTVLLGLCASALSSLVGQSQSVATPNQGNAQTKTLVVNGNTAPNAVVQVNGRAYADVLALAQLTGATVSVQPSRIVLNVPNMQAPSAQGFTREFARTSIAHLADLREWLGAISTTIKFGIPESQSLELWLQQYRNRAEESIRVAAVSATNPQDKSALQLLQNGFNNAVQWSSNAAQDRRSFNGAKAVDPAALQNDPLLSKIAECDRFLNSMISSGTFSDIGVCR